ncbi:MAG: hypothetical protein DSZ10_01735 [Sulfurovum sp.]|nr:MAG: hypothetical protein DSZ10_01735 [Sulfurovum sp.]
MTLTSFRSFITMFIIIVGITISAEAITRIMPLGDSITYDDTYADAEHPRPAGKRSGYRNYLWYKLRDVNFTADFVGSQIAGQDIRPPFDPDNEGHPGWTSYDIAEYTYGYMSNSKPDVVLLHIGTNDHATTSPDGVNRILDEINIYEENSGKHVQVYVALIIDRKEHDGRIKIFNERLKELLLKRISQGDDIVIVDMYHDIGLTSSDYADNTHPNDHGYYKMAGVWFNAIMNNININTNLRAFPTSLVPQESIVQVSYDDEKNSVTFLVDIPDSGIQF